MKVILEKISDEIDLSSLSQEERDRYIVERTDRGIALAQAGAAPSDVVTFLLTNYIKLNWRGGWDNENIYKYNDAVSHLGSSYVAIRVTTEEPSGTAVDWNLLAAKGNPGANGNTPYVGVNGNWWINGVDQNVKAEGVDGRGIVSIIKTSTVGLVDTYTITYSDATTSTFDVTNGTNCEMNVIEEVQVNSVPLTVTNKSVNVIVPTQPSDIGAEPANSNIQDHISDTDIHIDSSSELGEAINESTHSLLLWNGLKALKVTFARVKTWLSSLYLKLDQTTPQTIQGLLQNKSTTALESAPLSDELLTSSGWDSTGWTGDFATGFTHTTGNVTPLTNTLAALNNTLYQISFTVTNRTAGSFTVSFGSQTSGTYTSSNAWGVKTIGTGTLSITPTTDFNGTIVISIKRITGTYNATYQILDSAGISTLEIRSSLNTLNNTFIGKGAGRYNTTGSYNSAQGVSALQNNTTGSYNSAQGVSALSNNTTGSYNSAQGVSALSNNTTGSDNSAQGVYALRFNTTGYNNSAQGVQALYSNITGSNNSAQGVNALYSNTTGSNNSAQGSFALFSNTIGNNNSAQGVNAGRYLADGVTGNQTSNNSIFLGYNTKSKQASQTNEIVIGANAIGNGSNTVTLGHTDVTDTYLRGLVHLNNGIQISDNTSAASEALKGAIRYRTTANASYVEMCMQVSADTYSWIAIVTNTW